jgi:hypothetical protein
MFEPISTSKYKVGDKVKVIAASQGWAGVAKGEIGVVNSAPLDGKGFYYLTIHGYTTWSAHESDLEPYTESKKEGEPKVTPKFKVGDTVKMISPSPVHGPGPIRLGDVGTVTRVSDFPDDHGQYGYRVAFPIYTGWHGVEGEFEHVEAAPVKGITLKEAGTKPKATGSVQGRFPFRLSDGRLLVDSQQGFKVGDRVVNAECGEGTVKMMIGEAGDCIGVEYDTWDRGHDFHDIGREFGYIGKSRHCWFCRSSELKKITAEAGIKLVEKTEVAKGITLKTEAAPYEYYDEDEGREDFDDDEFGRDEDFDEDFEEPEGFLVTLIGGEEPMEGIRLVEKETGRGIRPVERKSERGGIMKAFEKMFGNVSIGKDTSGRVAITPMGMAVKNNEGKWVAYDGTALVDVMDVKFDIDNVFYRVPTLEIKAKDVIINQTGVPVIVSDVTKEAITVVNPYNGMKETIVPQTNIMGMKFYVKVINLFGDAFGKMDIMAKPESLLPFMLMSDGDSDDMLPMLLMSGALGKGGDMNTMLPFLLMGKGSDKSDMLPFLLMGQNGGEMSSMLPFLLMKDGGKDDMFQTMLLMNAMGGKGFNLFPAPAAKTEE